MFIIFLLRIGGQGFVWLPTIDVGEPSNVPNAGDIMLTEGQIRKRVLAHLRTQWPQIVEETDFRKDLGLRDQQVLDIGEELAKELGCNPKRSQIVACHTVKELIALLVKTRFTASRETLQSAARLSGATEGFLAEAWKGPPVQRKAFGV